MKIFTRFLLCMVVGFLPFLLKGQTADQYQFTATTGTFTAVSGGTAVPTILVDDAISTSITLPFTFKFEGISYTTVKVSSNGFLTFGTTTSSFATNNLATNAATSRPLVAPLWDDLDGRATGGSTASYVTTGTSPNQVFTFEWKNWEFNYASTNPVVSFQVKLYETTNVVEFWYQSESGVVNSGSASIGLAGVTSGKFLSLQSTSASPATSSSTEMTTISTKPASNTVYRFAPPPLCSAAPTGGTIPTAAATQIVCSSTVPAALTPTGITVASGLTYQWETATDAAFTTPTNATGTGATTASFTPAATPASFTAPIYYRLKVTCTASALFGYSTVATINIPAAPTTQALVSSFTATTTSVTLTLTAGSGGFRLVYFNSANSFTPPTDGLSTALPTAATAYTTGQQLVLNSGTSVIVTGLTIGTTYYAQTYEYLRCGSASPYTNYYNTTGSSATVNTAILLNYVPSLTKGITYTPVKTVAAGGNALLITNTGTQDDAAGQIPSASLTGFDFKYQGVSVTTLFACTNGFLRIGTTSTSFSNVFTVTNLIAPFYEDLFQPIGGTLAWEMTGTAPNRVLTVEWGNYEIYQYPGPNLNMQAKLYETTNVIEFVYGTFQGFDGTNPNGATTSFGYSYSYGIGLSASAVTAVPLAGEVLALEKEGTTSFTHLGTKTANKGLNKLTQMPECYSKYTFTPGVYTYAAPPSVSAPVNDEAAGAIVLTPLATTPTDFCGSYYTSFGATQSAKAVASSVSTTLNDDDVWFKFTAISSNTTITVRGSGGYDPVVELLDASLNSISAVNMTTLTSAATSMTETIAATGATATVSGNNYYVRVYHAGGGTTATGTAVLTAGVVTGVTIDAGGTGYITSYGGSTNVAFPSVTLSGGGGSGAVVSVSGVNSVVSAAATGPITAVTLNEGGSGYTSAPTVTFASPSAGITGEFSIIINATPDPPANDNCSGATNLVIGTTCAPSVLGVQSTNTATGSTSPTTVCAATNPDDDVWYKFTAPATLGQTLTFTIQGQAGFRAAAEVISVNAKTLDCAITTAWTQVGCVSATTNGGANTFTFSSYKPDSVYLLRVYHYGVGFGTGTGAGKFTICVSTACSAPTTIAAATVTASSANIGWTCTNCGTDYVLEYGATGFTPGTGATAGTGGTVVAITTPSVSPYTLTGLTQSTTYDFYLRQNCGSGLVSLNSVVRSFTTLEACPKPTAIDKNTVTPTSANVTWTCATCGTDPVIIEYGPVGFVPGTGTTAGAGTIVTTTTGSPYALSGLVSGTAYDLYVRRDCSGASNGLSANTAVLNFTTLVACTTLAASTTVSNLASVCAAQTFNLSLGTTYAEFGITYQWQTFDGTTGTNITGATSATYSSVTQTVATQYRCVITCAGGTVTNSTPITIGQNSSAQCYCSSGLGGSSSPAVSNVAITGTPLANNTGTTAAASFYTFNAAGALSPTLVKGATYSITVDASATSSISLWIDYDRNGTFDASEWTQVADYAANVATGTISFTVPSGALTGMTGLRVRTRASSSNIATDACTNFVSGETEDYLVNIIPAAVAGPATCSPEATVSSTNSGLWLHLMDGSGNVFASVLDNQVMGTITSSYITNVGAIRSVNGKKYMDRNLGINAATAPTSTVRMRIYFTDTELQALLTSIGFPSNTALTGLSVIRVPGASCTSTFVGTTGVNATISGSGTTTTTHYMELTVPGFSGFYITEPYVIPIELKSLTAAAKGATNVVKWTTSTELNVAEFIIERSANGRDAWTTIAHTKAAGTTQTEQNYQVTDNAPLMLSYYRLRSVETLGKSDVSKTVAVKRNGGKLALLMVSPNPTTDDINVDISTGRVSKLNIVIMDIVGRVVKTETFTTVEGANAMRLDLSNLAQGSYILTLNDGETLATQRIVKQ